ncbi:hypothetical protein L207DRAFT_571905 [Hyaloscypha variabilis F]|uniref:Uncharacterized protein n=1 Tax=Hyaloscypha variabilis (strain UAMH 11265 / GT02V1 / F) TaxID=1149755 RepID=A0A2J6R260_HYAVF|nr:hypothetical protein L207DRAFT_571905 [Hyaloscypha variabilis F]
MVFANAATIAGAYFTMPESSYLNVHTGSVFNISWAGAVGLTDIHLEGHGAGDSLFAGDIIIAYAVQTPAGFYLWTIPTNLTSIIASDGLYSFLIVNDQSTDSPNEYSAWFNITPPGTPSTSLAATPSLANPTASYSYPAATGATGGGGGDLGTGAKVGIGVAVPVGVLICVGLGLWYFWRGKGKKGKVVGSGDRGGDGRKGRNVLDKAELEGGVDGKGPLSEPKGPLGEDERGELDGGVGVRAKTEQGPLSEDERAELEALRREKAELKGMTEFRASELKDKPKEEVVEKGPDGEDERVELEARRKGDGNERFELS